MYDIYISNLAANSRNHCLQKGFSGQKSEQSTLAGTQQYKRERRTYKIIAMPQSRILVGQAVRSRRNIVLVVFASCITGNNDMLVYLKYIGQVMLNGFKGEVPRPWRVLGILPDGGNQVRNVKGDDVVLAIGVR